MAQIPISFNTSMLELRVFFCFNFSPLP